jgi:hypothetical protein
MGMFDTIRSSYDLGPSFWNKDLQTKDLEQMMSRFWIDPAGRLFEIDYSGTQDFELDGAVGWDVTPNGNHGRVTPYLLTRTIEVYPAKWDAHYAAYPRQNITFIDGVLRK